MFCHNCGNKTEEGALFCAECGAKLNPSPEEIAAMNEAVAPQPEPTPEPTLEPTPEPAPEPAPTPSDDPVPRIPEPGPKTPMWDPPMDPEPPKKGKKTGLIIGLIVGIAVVLAAVAVGAVLLFGQEKEPAKTPDSNSGNTAVVDPDEAISDLMLLLNAEDLFTGTQMERLHPEFRDYFTRFLQLESDCSATKLAETFNQALAYSSQSIESIDVTLTNYAEGDFSEVQERWSEDYEFDGYPRKIYYTRGKVVFHYGDGSSQTKNFSASAGDTYIYIIETDGQYYWVTE